MDKMIDQLPFEYRKLVPQPNFTPLDFTHLSNTSPDIIIQSLKTKTILQLLQPPKVAQTVNQIGIQPIILVFCQPSEQITIQRDKIFPYTPISYVNWLEAAGAKCIPLPYNINEGSIEFLLERSHGLLIPGGGSNLYRNFQQKEGQGPVMQGFIKIWRHIQKMWSKGIKYPIWGTCLGFQIILLALTSDTKVLSHLNSRGHQVEIFSDYQNSWMLHKMPLKLKLKSENRKLINFQHSYGITVKKFLSQAKLVEKMKIVQVSKDKDGKWFCSGLEGKSLPIFISQYHPQKQSYQWTRTGEIKHNRDSIQLSQHLASMFVEECSKCKPMKHFGSEIEQLFYSFHHYKQIHNQKMYKVYAIDFKYRENDKEARKDIKTKRSLSSTHNVNRKVRVTVM